MDFLIILFVVAWLYWGYRNGFWQGLESVVGLALSIVVATASYPLVGNLLYQQSTLPIGLSNLIGFIVIFFIFRVIYWSLVALIEPRITISTLRHRWLRARHAAGLMPGVILAYIWLTLILTSLAWFPISTFFKQLIESSYLSQPIVAHATFLQPRLERLVRPAVSDTVAFFAIRERDTKLDFPDDIKLSVDIQAEETMLTLVNKERTSHGLSPLVLDRALRDVARQHSAEMFDLGYFDHNSPVLGSPFERMLRRGVTFTVAGENIAYAQNVRFAHEGLMNSPSHRAAILSPDFGRVGIGVVDGGIYGQMFTQEFTN